MRTLAVLMLLAAAAVADVESGPKPDAAVPELKVTFATGTNEAKEVNVPGERKDEPTVYLFVNSGKFSRPVGRFLKVLDEKIGDANGKAHAYAVWVGADAEKTNDYLPKVNESMKFTKTDLAWTKTATPEGWGLNDDAHLTVVVTKGKKVFKVFAWVSVSEKDVPKVLEAVK